MMTILNLAEQCYAILKKGTVQEYAQAVKQAYATAVKKHWYEGKAEGVDEINGSFVVAHPDLQPELDSSTGQYYVLIPTSYLELPHEMGINHVSFMKGQDAPFVRFALGQFGLFSGLKSFVMGGNQVFQVEGNRMYFPYMKRSDVFVRDEVRGILLKLTIGLDTTDVDAQLNISPAIADEIVSMVVSKYQAKEKTLTNNLV